MLLFLFSSMQTFGVSCGKQEKMRRKNVDLDGKIDVVKLTRICFFSQRMN